MSPPRKAIVTGGATGIGKAVVEHLAREGFEIVFSYFSHDRLARDLVGRLEAECGARCSAFSCDVRDPERVRALFQAGMDFLGDLDVLVNNAGITRDANLMTMDAESWNLVLDTNLTGTFNMTKAVVTTLLRKRSGNIVNISSVAGKIGLPGQSNYAASKAGLIGFTRSLAKELASRNITVNAVSPGFIETDMTAELSERYRDQLSQQIPMARFGRPEEVAALVHYLTLPEARYITGQSFIIDGGLSL